MINVLHFKDVGAGTMAAAINAFHTQLTLLYAAASGGFGGNGWANNASTAASIQDVVYTPLDGISASTIKTMVTVGVSAADALPSDTAIVFTLRTLARGRSYRGRCYWGGFTETFNTAAGKIDTTALAAFVTHWGGFLTAALAADAPLVVASYLLSTSTVVTSVDSNTRWDRQRRRS